MLSFRNTNIFFAALIACLLAYNYTNSFSPIIYIAVLFIYSLNVFWGCYYVGSNFFIPIVCKANTHKKVIAISFDDGPSKNYTPEILQVLKHENVQAAFFCIGNRIAGNEEIVKQWHNEQHIIGNHSFSHHFWFDMYSAKKISADLTSMDNALENVIGLKPKLFRPPYGVTNPNVAKAIKQGGYTPVGWSVRSMDTVIKDEQKLLEKMNKGLKPGAIFLFHDTSKATLNILPKFIKHVKDMGYEIIRLDKLLDLQSYA